MKKFLIKSVLFLVYLLIIGVILENIFKQLTPKEDRYAWQYEELFDPKVKADIVVIGSSKSVKGINPKMLEEENISAFNFGLDGSSSKFTYEYYQHFFKKHYPKPKLILLDVSWLMLDSGSMWRSLEQDSRYFPSEDYFSLFKRSEKKHAAFYNRHYIFNRSVGFDGDLELSYRGFTPKSKTTNTESVINPLDFNPENNLEYFELLLTTLKEEKLNVLLVVLPENLDNEVLENANITYCMNRINDLADRHGFPVLDYQHYFDSEDYFYDWGHLNLEGANIISSKIKEDIIKFSKENIYSN